MSYEPPVKQRVRWGRVALFYGLALGWVTLVTAALYLTGTHSFASGAAGSVAMMVVAALYMPAPLAAALVVERLDRRPLGLRRAFTGFWRKLPLIAAITAALVAVTMAGMLAASWLAGNVLGISAAGTLLFTPEDLVANVLALMPATNAEQVAAMSASMPSLWGLAGVLLLSALVAGLTINGLFGFGEEYGWRGWLADELRPLGAFWANVITGVLWGFWHAPLILLGFNYGEYTKLGPFFMVAFCLPFSFLLWRVREVTGSIWAAAVLHGAFNAFAGLFVLALADPNPLVAAPVGLIGSGVIAVVAAGFWLLTAKRARTLAA